MKKSYLKTIIREELDELINEIGSSEPGSEEEQERVEAGMYTAGEREDLNPIKRSHRNQGMGPTKLNALINALYNAEREMSKYVETNLDPNIGITDPNRFDDAHTSLAEMRRPLKVIQRMIHLMQRYVKRGSELAAKGASPGHSRDSGLN